MIFKKIRSIVGRLFSENQQMLIVMWLSEIFWGLRKYFLSVVIEYPAEFIENWKIIKNQSSQDKERNFTVYQMVKIHNKIFEGKKTNAIEFGTDRGGTLTTISKFIKKDTDIFSVDSFGFHADEIKKNISVFDEHYHGKYKPFTKQTRFRDFSHIQMTNNLNDILIKKNSKLETIVGYFPNLDEVSMKKISNLKYSFVHLDFDLYQPTIDCFKFIENRLEKNAIILVDDYNFINQEGVKRAVIDLKIDLDKGVQTQSGQLILYT
jgi:hypothetical protein